MKKRFVISRLYDKLICTLVAVFAVGHPNIFTIIMTTFIYIQIFIYYGNFTNCF